MKTPDTYYIIKMQFQKGFFNSLCRVFAAHRNTERAFFCGNTDTFTDGKRTQHTTAYGAPYMDH